MSDQPQRPHDDMRQDYLDGRLDADGLADFERMMSDDPGFAADVAADRDLNERLKTLRGEVLLEPTPERLLSVLRPAGGNWQPVLLRIAAGILLFALGGTAGWWGERTLNDEDSLLRPLIRQAVLTHEAALAGRTSNAEGIGVGSDDEAQANLIAAAFESPIRVPVARNAVVTPIAVSTAKGAAGETLNVSYVDKDDRLITLFARRHSERGELPVRFTAMDGLSAMYWLDGPLLYVLVSDADREELLGLADMIYTSPAVGGKPRSGQISQ